MKIKEITEHLLMNPSKLPIWLNQELSGYILTGEKLEMPLRMTYGDFIIYKKDNYYGVFDDDNNLCVFAELKKFNEELWQFTKLEKDKTKNINDMGAALLHYFVLDLSMSIISDDVMSDDGNKFWETISSRNQMPITIYDSFTGMDYLKSDIGKLTSTEPKVRILNPKEDFDYSDFNENGKKIYRDSNSYRWYWLATIDGIKGKSHYLKEQIERGNYPSECFMFGEQKYPNEIR